jgi:hypothetical protein
MYTVRRITDLDYRITKVLKLNTSEEWIILVQKLMSYPISSLSPQSTSATYRVYKHSSHSTSITALEN